MPRRSATGGAARCRWSLRMPWGGLRHAGPYHSQNTEAWFFRTPGLKIVAPSTPHDARALMAAAVADPDPVLYYEHIALYRDPRIKQALSEAAARADPARQGRPAAQGLRPRDRLLRRLRPRGDARGREARPGGSGGLGARPALPRPPRPRGASRSRRGAAAASSSSTRTRAPVSIGESLAAVIQEETFEYLDAPVRVVGALDTPGAVLPAARRILPPLGRVGRAGGAPARRVLIAPRVPA